jgi:hypothetical protein
VNIRNNIPIDPVSKFSTATGKIFSCSLLKNNSDKSAIVYHYCYLNGKKNTKVRTRVGNGNDIHTISHRDLETTNKLTWKVKIKQDDKKILDTHIFELV